MGRMAMRAIRGRSLMSMNATFYILFNAAVQLCKGRNTIVHTVIVIITEIQKWLLLGHFE